MRFYSLLFLWAIGITGCQPVRSVDPSPTSTTAIATEPLSPTPIRIRLDSLPPPFATESASQPPQVVPIPTSPVLQVPPGFTVNVFAEGLAQPRWLALTPTGEVLVTETRENRIRLLKDTNGDGIADINRTFADARNGLNIPFGMAFSPGNSASQLNPGQTRVGAIGNRPLRHIASQEQSLYFYVGNTAEVRRFPYQKGQPQITGQGEKITDLPGGGYHQHWTRNVVVSADGQKLYVSIGSRSNVDEEELPRASVQVMNLDGSHRETFAFGLRNPVGLDFHPKTGELYATVNERDGLGNDLVPDYLTRIRQGEFYGWPYAYLSSDRLDPRRKRNGSSERSDLAQQTRTPDVLFQAHSAALGLQFYDGDTFPENYRNGAFVAFRGSWNRDRGTGYKVVFVPFNEAGRPLGNYQDFLTGFLLDPQVPTTWGRPVGLLVLPDGSLLVTEEANNRIYRIQYPGQRDSSKG